MQGLNPPIKTDTKAERADEQNTATMRVTWSVPPAVLKSQCAGVHRVSVNEPTRSCSDSDVPQDERPAAASPSTPARRSMRDDQVKDAAAPKVVHRV